MSKLIENWEELSKVENSKTHYLEIEVDNGCGWIMAKKGINFNNYIYLSTHTFYGSEYKKSTKLLQNCGFDVELANWDELEEYKY